MNKQPRDLTDDMKKFLLYLRGDDKTKVKPIAKKIIIKTKDNVTKFKLRCPRYLYTLKVDEANRAEKIKSAIPNSIQKVELSQKKGRKTEKATGKKAPKKN